MLTIEERTKEANRKVTEFHHQQRRNNRQQREALEKKEQRQNYIIGKSFARFFPMIRILEPGTADENAITFKPLETFFSKLSEKPDLVEMLSTLINDSVKENICSIQCISGQTNFVEQTGDERR